MDKSTLKTENTFYRGSAGVSQNNRCHGFLPAFRDTRSGRVEVSRMKNGNPAPVHLIDWLPKGWALETGPDGAIRSLRPEIVSGFVRNGVFYTRQECLEIA
ncbi:MAG: hypothetical protein ACFHX7_17425 [Pseudomonadota bacterium]